MKLLKFINNRIFITTVLLLIQIVWFIVFLIRLTNYSVYITAIFTIISLLMVLNIVSKDENASFKIAWIILILVLPLFGGLFYVLFGNKRPSKGMRFLLNKERVKILEVMKFNDTIKEEISNDRIVGTFNYLEDNHFPLYKNTESKYFKSGEDMFEDMLKEIRKAKRFIFLEYFIIETGYMWDKLEYELLKKVKEGLDVRLIYDDVGSLFLLPKDFKKDLENKGIKVLAFNKFRPFLSLVMNNRNHRKMLIIDDVTMFTGGINIADEYINKIERFGYWKDTGIKIQGEAVRSNTLMFLEMWNAFRKTDNDYNEFTAAKKELTKYKTDGFIQPYFDSPMDHEAIGENVYIEILAQAKDYVYIFTPYLIIDNEMKDALCMAAKRGVDVRIVTPGIPDKKIIFRLTRSNYEPLLKAGVKIYEYTPGFIHAKSYVSDDIVGVVGTINMDFRSLYLHFECATLLYKTKSIQDLKEDSLNTINESEEIKLDDMKKGIISKIIDSTLRLFAPLT